ncbi:MAG TPA: hypothetical protein VIL00_00180 [Pseudonocardiaceae bacterium]
MSTLGVLVLNRWRFIAGVLAALVTGLLLTPPAHAAASPTPISTTQFALSADYNRYDTLLAQLDARLPKVTVAQVMDTANHDRQPLCHVSGLSGPVVGFCWTSSDDAHCNNVPQGITTTRDATGGEYQGRQLVVVSWYYQDECGGATTRSRLTLVDWDADHPNRYRKVLLVEPVSTAQGPSFRNIPIHAGGISWYGDYLYVADTWNGMRVFDMRRIWEVDTTKDGIGLQPDGRYGAHNYRYVLPQVGMITDVGSTQLRWSTIGLDRAQPSIVMGEYETDRSTYAVRFPLDPNTHRFTVSSDGLVHATQALSVPYVGVQGVVSHNGRWWFASSREKQLHYWVPGSAARTYSWVSWCESLSYWEDPNKPDLLWSLRENAGDRSVFAVEQQYYD